MLFLGAHLLPLVEAALPQRFLQGGGSVLEMLDAIGISVAFFSVYGFDARSGYLSLSDCATFWEQIDVCDHGSDTDIRRY